MTQTSFYTDDELSSLGLKSYGKNVLISRKTSIYSPSRISIGDNVRIDDYCVLSGTITLGSHIHIAAYCALYGAKGIEMQDYTGLSARVTIYSAVDDFSGEYLVGPQHDEKDTNVIGGRVILEAYSQVCASCVILPNLTIGEGAVVGAMSFVKQSLVPWTIYAGIPVKAIKVRATTIKHITSTQYEY